MSDAIIAALTRVLEDRRQADPQKSYVAGLYRGGRELILRKTGEEAIEVLLAAQGADKQALVHEIADLWFHTMVLLIHEGQQPAAVLAELERRFGTSGVAEKAARND
jgi:phosphoribosyl-ATP pyrophosphohydrolase